MCLEDGETIMGIGDLDLSGFGSLTSRVIFMNP